MSLPGIRILVIEDNRDVLSMYVLLLGMEGATVTGAANGREALTHSRTAAYDVVLSDLGLPDIPGEILIGAIRASVGRRLGVLVVTGGSPEARVQAYEAGDDVVFTKPADWPSVVESLADLATRAAA